MASIRPGIFNVSGIVISAALSGRRQDKKRQRVAEESSAAFEETRAKWQSWHESDQDLSSSWSRDSSPLNCDMPLNAELVGVLLSGRRSCRAVRVR